MKAIKFAHGGPAIKAMDRAAQVKLNTLCTVLDSRGRNLN